MRNLWIGSRSRTRRLAGLLACTAVLLAACTRGGAPPFPAQPTQAEALSKPLGRPVQIAYREPFDQDRALVLFRTARDPGLSPALLEQTGFGQWRMTEAVGLHQRLRGLGPLTYEQASVGHVEEKHGTTTTTRAEAAVLYGEVLNPAVTWVELTLENGETQTVRAEVKDGIWLVKVPNANRIVRFSITAGGASGRLYAAVMASAPLDNPGEVAEFEDRAAGILFRNRYARSPMFDGERYRFGFLDGELFIRPMEHSGQTPQELLARFLQAPAPGVKVEVLEQGTGRVGGHDAAFVRESRTGPADEQRQNVAVYFVVSPEADYEVTCESAQVKNPLPWDVLQPRCEQLLDSLWLGRSVDP